MGGIKRKLKRYKRMEDIPPQAECFCGSGVLSVIFNYRKEIIALVWDIMPVVDGVLPSLDAKINRAIKETPYEGEDALCEIVVSVVEQEYSDSLIIREEIR